MMGVLIEKKTVLDKKLKEKPEGKTAAAEREDVVNKLTALISQLNFDQQVLSSVITAMKGEAETSSKYHK